jgi:prophage tail gpP-like protein
MPSLMRRAAWRLAATVFAAAAAAACAVGCTPKASATQCDELLDRYAQLVVTEQLHDASAEQMRAERERERSEARADDAFKNCSSEVSRAEFDCAMRAANANAFEKCLE